MRGARSERSERMPPDLIDEMVTILADSLDAVVRN